MGAFIVICVSHVSGAFSANFTANYSVSKAFSREQRRARASSSLIKANTASRSDLKGSQGNGGIYWSARLSNSNGTPRYDLVGCHVETLAANVTPIGINQRVAAVVVPKPTATLISATEWRHRIPIETPETPLAVLSRRFAANVIGR
jgi:hypothetical protein